MIFVGDPFDDIEGVIDEDELLKMFLPNFHSVVMVLQASLQVVEEHELLASVSSDKRDSVVNRLHYLQQSIMFVTDEVLLVSNQKMAELLP